MIIILCYVERNNIRYDSTRLGIDFLPFPLRSILSSIQTESSEMKTLEKDRSLHLSDREQKFKKTNCLFFNETRFLAGMTFLLFFFFLKRFILVERNGEIFSGHRLLVRIRRFSSFLREVGISADLIRGRSSNFYGVWGRGAGGDGSHDNVT